MRTLAHPIELSVPGAAMVDDRVRADLSAALDRGARVFHIGAMPPGDPPAFSTTIVEGWVAGVREKTPTATIVVAVEVAGHSAKAWAVALRRSRLRPDYAALDFTDPAAPDLADMMIGHGIGIEARIETGEAMARFLAYPKNPFCRRLVFPVTQGTGGSSSVGFSVSRAFMGERRDGHEVTFAFDEPVDWAVAAHALRLGYGVRLSPPTGSQQPAGRRAGALRASGSLAEQYRIARSLFPANDRERRTDPTLVIA